MYECMYQTDDFLQMVKSLEKKRVYHIDISKQVFSYLNFMYNNLVINSNMFIKCGGWGSSTLIC